MSNEAEIDYAEPPNEEDDYQYYEADKFADSYSARERTTGFDDEGWRDDTLGFNKDFPNMFISPEDKFKNDVQIILIHSGIDRLNKKDKQTIVGKQKDIHWIKFKVPLLYVLGYYVASRGFEENHIEYAMDFLTDNVIARFELIKYARYWKSILEL